MGGGDGSFPGGLLSTVGRNRLPQAATTSKRGTAERKGDRPARPQQDGGDVLGTKGKLQHLLLHRKSRSWLGARAHQKTERVMATLFTNLFASALSSLAAQSIHFLKRWIFFFLFKFK